MSGPFLMIVFPLAMAPAAYALHRWRWAELAAILGTTALLALMVLRLPLGEPLHFLTLTFTVERTMTVLGRPFTFGLNHRPALMFLYLAATLVFAGSLTQRMHRAFLPAGLAGLGMLSAALFVQPFLFAAIFLQLVAALAVAMLLDPEAPSPRGTVRFLVYKTLGMPFILITAWLLENSALSPGDVSLATRATLLLGAGFAILLAVVPFHTWIPQLAEEAPAFASAYVFAILQGSTTFLLLAFLNEFDWLRENPLTHRSLQLAGLALILLGGVLGTVQQNFGRLMGYTMLVDFGAVLSAIGLGTADGVAAALVTVAARVFNLTCWAAGASVLRAEAGGTDFSRLRGAAWRWPLASGAVLVGGLSAVGFPLTVGFAGRWALYGQLAPAVFDTALLLWAASVGLTLAHFRGLASLLSHGERSGLALQEGFGARMVIVVGLFVVLGLGLFPQLALPAVARAVLSFGNLAP